jgi:hypothetical protein
VFLVHRDRVAHAVSRVHFVPQTLGMQPPPQVSGGVQFPHWITWPQPSLVWPHVKPSSAHVDGKQGGAPHCAGMPPPPQDAPIGHAPQLIAWPQPSVKGPHWICGGQP